jgi:exopolyphosphatase/guanosine-5'-triphosphate,3'-diphosphate pyrophosphatase
MIGRVLNMNFDERIANPCIGQDRADLVLAGCAILEAFHREWPCPRLRVADRGLREGILMEMMLDDGVWQPQSGKKRSGKNRRPRRRGGRGHRGQTGFATAPNEQGGGSDQN